MAKIELLVPKIVKWEGGWVNDPTDLGGATNMGVTIATWKQVGYDKDHDGDIDVDDLKILSSDDFKFVLRKYWNVWLADLINNQSIANILVDWVWGSGKWGVVKPQYLLGITADGVVGIKTIDAVNKADQEKLFKDIFNARTLFLNNIIKNDPTQVKFIKGWRNRLNDFKFEK